MMRASLVRLPLLAILAALTLAFGGTAAAQQQEGGDAAQPPTAQQPQMELQQLQQQLAQIQQQAFENNPELQQQAEELETLFIDTMTEAGYEPERGLQRLREIQGEMRAEDTTDDQRRELLEEARGIQSRLQEGQQVAMQEQQIIDAQSRFEQDLMDAMRAENPQTDELIARFEQIQQELQQQMLQQGQ